MSAFLPEVFSAVVAVGFKPLGSTDEAGFGLLALLLK